MDRVYRITREEHSSSSPSSLPLHEALNDEQKSVVLAEGGPILVIAGAGTGKTRTLTWRLARLIERGVPPSRILLLTFTNQAAREMRERAEQLIHAQASAVVAGTFHSVGRRFVTEFAAQLGYPERCTIIDREDAEDLIRQILGELEINTKTGSRFPRASTLADLLSSSINTGTTIEDALRQDCPQFLGHLERIHDVLLRYQNRKQQLGLLDFDDLLVLWHRLLTAHPEVASRLAARFEHILVDEYQDTNTLQTEIIDRMAAGHRNLVAVGDDSQAIYAFRGADYRNIHEFPQRHPDCRVLRLQQNYRSTPAILRLANHSIAHNRSAFPKQLTTRNPEGSPPAVVQCGNDREEALFVAQRILELRDEEIPLSQIAVLYRAHTHAIAVELELRRRQIPYIIRSGIRFFEQRHIKDVLAGLRMARSPRDELATLRVLRLCDGIGSVSATRIAAFLATRSDLSTALRDPRLDGLIPARARNAFHELRETLLLLCEAPGLRTPEPAIRHLLDRWYRPLIGRLYEMPGNRAQEIEALADYATRHESTDELLDQVALEGNLSGEELRDHEKPDEAVVLSTIHRAKGLEFHATFLISLVEERFPSAGSLFRDEAMEEERRVFHVAITRARRELYLTRPMITTVRGETIMARPSRFIEEIASVEPPLYERWRLG